MDYTGIVQVPQEEESLGRKIWNKAVHGRLIYLVFFNVGASFTLIISLFLAGSALINLKIIEICILATAVILKTTAVAKVLTLKQLLKTQSEFIIPYLFTVVNIFLVAEVCGYLNQYDPTQYNFNVRFAVIESFRFFFMTYMCSMITNKKTTSKCEYYWYQIILVIVVCCDVYIIVLKIKNYGSMLDTMADQQSDNLISYIKNSTTPLQYQELKDSIGNRSTAIENASDVDIACVASVVANYLVMMDFIARPLQKIEEAHHILHEASKHDKRKRTDISHKLMPNNNLNSSLPVTDRSHSERDHVRQTQELQVRKSNI